MASMRRVLIFLVSFLSLASRGPAWAYDGVVLPSVAFSATAVQESGAVITRETLHYADGKLRIDRANGFSSTILDFATQSEYLLMVNHTYLVMPMDDALFRRFVARNPDTTGARKIGTDTIDGLETTKYAFGDDGPLKAAGTYWVTNSGIMVRRKYDDGVFGANVHHLEELTHIAFGPQPKSLFVIPAGYRPAK